MRKIPTLFVRDFTRDNGRYVTEEVTPGCEWVLAGEGVPTRKYDGTCVLLDEYGRWWARREVKAGKPEPAGFMPEERDNTTGKTVGWEPIEQSPFAKFHAEALSHTEPFQYEPGTFELIGPKINRNPEHADMHALVRHSGAQRLVIPFAPPWTPLMIEDYVRAIGERGWEGIVWHHPDGRMAKIKARDFRPVVEGIIS